MNWNIRGLNADDKRNAVRAKIEESACVIFCLQETKMQSFDHSLVRKMAPDVITSLLMYLQKGLLVASLWVGTVSFSQERFPTQWSFPSLSGSKLPIMQKNGCLQTYMAPVVDKIGITS
jgi:exonuclease III